MLAVRVALVLLILGAGTVLVLQNSGPMTVTLLGLRSLSLSLGLWMAIAGLCGAVVGWVLRWLIRRADWSSAPVQPRRTKTTQSRRNPKSGQSRMPPPTSNPSGSDWYTPISQDWSEPSPPRSANAYEARRQARPNDVYGRYDDADDDEPLPSRDRVVDADYRVLTPPYRGRADDEWEDEFFEEEP